MKINLDVHLNIEGNRIMQGGQFEVSNREYKEDPERAAGIVAYKFIEKIKSQTGNRNTVIELVTLNGQEDITEKVKKLRTVVDSRNLPF